MSFGNFSLRLWALILMLLVWNNNASARDVYVMSDSGATCNTSTGDGSEGNPYRSLYWTMTQSNLACGDRLILKGGVYRIKKTSAFFSNNERQQNCSNKDLSFSGYDGGSAVLPIFGSRYNCPLSRPLLIENAPGANVVLDGTDLMMESGNNWQRCTSTNCCGEVVDVRANNVSDLTKYFCSKNFNVGTSMTPQLWVAPQDEYASEVGERLQWWANYKDPNDYLKDFTGSPNINDHFKGMGPGKFFAANNGNLIVLRLNDDSDPNTKKIKLNCQEGSCAAHLISVNGNASNVIVRKSLRGGKFQLKYAYFPIYSTGDDSRSPSRIQFLNLEIMAAGGRDYGQCARVYRGNYFRFSHIDCHDSMAEGIAIYGGGPGNASLNPCSSYGSCQAEGVNLLGHRVVKSKIRKTGLAFLDGGQKGNASLGQGIIMKNCSKCMAAGNRISNTLRGGIQVNTSDSCGWISNAKQQCRSNFVKIINNRIWDTCREVIVSGPYPGDPSHAKEYCGAVHVFLNGGESLHQISNMEVKGNDVNKQFSFWISNGVTPPGMAFDGPVRASVSDNVFNSGLQLKERENAQVTDWNNFFFQ